jgi:putative resolvase
MISVMIWIAGWRGYRSAAANAGSAVVRVVAEVGSGMSGARRRGAAAAGRSVGGHGGRASGSVGWMNTELVEAALSAHGRWLVVLDCGEVTDDVVGVLTWFCARLFGRRSARNRAIKAVGCAQRNIGPKLVGAIGQDGPHEQAATPDG